MFKAWLPGLYGLHRALDRVAWLFVPAVRTLTTCDFLNPRSNPQKGRPKHPKLPATAHDDNAPSSSRCPCHAKVAGLRHRENEKSKLQKQSFRVSTLTVTWVVSKLGSLLGSFFIKVPYYIWDLKRDPIWENYPHKGLGLRVSCSQATPLRKSTMLMTALVSDAIVPCDPDACE